MTIYNDLKKISDENIILTKKEVVFTGRNSLVDESHFKRLNYYAKSKKIIASKALKYINNFDTIFFDGSTTTHFLAKSLILMKNIQNITIITYSPIISLELIKNPGINVICLGGKFERINYIFLEKDLSYFDNININKSFISSVGISPQSGFTEIIEEEANLKRKLLEVSPENNILADISKFDRAGTYTFGPLIAVTRIFVDKPDIIKNNIKYSAVMDKII